MSLRVSVLVFPGSNCDHDAYHAARHVFEWDTRFVWHKETSLGNVDLVIVPGGFSYGDYLRAGAIAGFSHIMKEVVRFAQKGGFVLGICNGFQVLCETGLLPGALLRNSSLRFVCRWTYLRTENANTAFTCALTPKQVVRIPVAHGEGNYYADRATLDDLEANKQVVFRYCTEDGSFSEAANPNGSARHIAGIVNRERTVLGMMPHPERCTEMVLGSADGGLLFESLATYHRVLLS